MFIIYTRNTIDSSLSRSILVKTSSKFPATATEWLRGGAPYQQPAFLIHLKEPDLKTDSFPNDQPAEVAEWL